ncbi:type IV secretory pathway ATPase VirB11/archaellum biosynthesis ATPase [Sinorhizobium fredii]
MTEGPDATVVRELLSPFAPFLDDKSLYEVIVNRPGQVLTEGTGGWRTHDLPELSFEKLMRLARAVASFSSQSIDETRPILSATLPGDERIQIVIPPATTRNTVSLTIRKPSSVTYTLDDLEQSEFFSETRAANDGVSTQDHDLLALYRAGRFKDFLREAVIARKNIIISGATGSAKTTLSKALIKHIPEHERIISIEDTPNWLFRSPTTCVCSIRRAARVFRGLAPKSSWNHASGCDRTEFCCRSCAMARHFIMCVTSTLATLDRSPPSMPIPPSSPSSS